MFFFKIYHFAFTGWRLEGAVVRIGSSATYGTNKQCGQAVNKEQAAVAGGTVELDCAQPIKGKTLQIGIPSTTAAVQLCEVRVWELPMAYCEGNP